MNWLRFSIFLVLAAWVLPAGAEAHKTVSSKRIRLADIVQAPSAELGDVDLGAAPPPGSSRLIVRSEIASRLESAGYGTTSLKLPYAVRVKSAAKRLTSDELAKLAASELQKQLPPGVTLTEVRATESVLISPSAKVGEVKLPRLPRKAGPFVTTGIVTFFHEGELTANAPVSLKLEISEQAAEPFITKGTVLSLSIERGRTSVSAKAVALADTERGSVGTFKVVKTRKLLKARVIDKGLARVVEE